MVISGVWKDLRPVIGDQDQFGFRFSYWPDSMDYLINSQIVLRHSINLGFQTDLAWEQYMGILPTAINIRVRIAQDQDGLTGFISVYASRSLKIVELEGFGWFEGFTDLFHFLQ